MIVIYRL